MRLKYFAAIILMFVSTAYAAVTVTVNGSNYSIPQTNEKGWGTNVTTWIQAISANTLQPSGGAFTLSADVDFGANYGLKGIYLKSRALNPSTVGVLRLGNTESIGWRNAANGANVLLSVDSSDRLTFNGNPLVSSSALTGSRTVVTDASGVLASSSVTTTELGLLSGVTGTLVTETGTQTLTNKTLTAPVIATISNTGTLTLPTASTTIVGRDTTDTLTNKTIDADGTGNSITNIENADIKSGANIAHDKMAALTASRAMVTDGSGVASASSVTATELGYVSGVTSGIQTQLGGKVALSTVTTKGDIIAATGSATVDRLAVGADGTFLKANSANATGLEWGSVTNNLAVASKTTTYTATTSDDVILASTSGGAWTLTLYTAAGNSGKVLKVKKTTSDTNTLTIDGDGSETIDGQTTFSIAGQYEEVSIVSDGTNWHVLDFRPTDVRAASSSTHTPTGSGQYHNMTGNSLTLPPGTWQLTGTSVFGSAGSAGYSYILTQWAGADGADSGSAPAALSTIGTVTGVVTADFGIAGDVITLTAATAVFTNTSSQTIYLVTYSSQTTSASARITARLLARRIK